MKSVTLKAELVSKEINERFYQEVIPGLHKMGVTHQTKIQLSDDAQKYFRKQRDINTFINVLKRRLEAYQSALTSKELVAA